MFCSTKVGRKIKKLNFILEKCRVYIWICYIFASVYGKIKKYISCYIPIVNVPSCFKFCH